MKRLPPDTSPASINLCMENASIPGWAPFLHLTELQVQRISWLWQNLTPVVPTSTPYSYIACLRNSLAAIFIASS